ncbi:MAG: hypothetical protein LC643_06645 [Bacteroidales bacterium]|nr:hypothetical protein [Bacteroidales bacterium]
MCTYNKKLVLLILAVWISVSGYSQLRRGYSTQPFDLLSGMSITPKGGANMFFGDLVDQSRTSYSVGVLANREMSRTLSARANLMAGAMKGEQVPPTQDDPYATFENMYIEFGLGLSYRPFNHILGYFKERTVQPYILAQAGLIYFSATEYWGPASSGTTGAQPGEIWREVNGLTPMVSAGGGISFWLTPSLSANLEVTGTLPFSDQLDGHDVWYDSWPDGNVHETDPYDFYYTASVGLTFLISDSPFRNDPRYNRRSYTKTRRFFQPKSRSRSSRPSSHTRNRFLFF